MTNAEIIFRASIELMKAGTINPSGRTITVQDANGNKSEMPEPEAIHTYAAWKELGRQVKKGQKARAEIVIWKHTSKVKEMEVTYKDGTTGTEDVEDSRMFMKKAFFFTIDQTEEIVKKPTETRKVS